MGGKGSGNKMAYKNAKGAKSPVIGDNGISLAPGEMAKITREALTVGFVWPPIDNKDPEQLQQRTIDYLNYCIDNDSKPGNMGLYLAWGMDRREVYYVVGKEPSSARVGIIKKSQAILSQIREKMMADGKINPVTGIFWQKNYDGLKDQQDVVVSAQTGPEADRTPEEIAAQLEQDIPIDTDATEIE